MQPEVAAIVGLAIVTGFTVLVAFLVSRITSLKTEVPKLVAMLPSDLQKLVQDAADFGSMFVEQMDKNGELSKALNDLKPQAEQKLDLAVDYAVQYLEGIFQKSGFPVDVDQDALKAVIQKYVWDNPSLFPSNSDAPTIPMDTSTTVAG